MSVKKFVGKVVSDKMTRAVVVTVEMYTKHSVYLKSIANTKRIKARNDVGVKTGDLVQIQECKPLAGGISFMVVGKVEGK